MTSSSSVPEHVVPRPRPIPGHRVVLALLLFGSLATAGMWTYWKLHLAPFFPLQQALAAEFPKSSPRVEGGRNKQSPMTLRVVLHVPFPPDRNDTHTLSVVDRIRQLTGEHQDLRPYRLLEIFLVHRVPERSAEREKWEFRLDGASEPAQDAAQSPAS